MNILYLERFVELLESAIRLIELAVADVNICLVHLGVPARAVVSAAQYRAQVNGVGTRPDLLPVA